MSKNRSVRSTEDAHQQRLKRIRCSHPITAEETWMGGPRTDKIIDAVVRGQRPSLRVRMAANRDLPKLGSSCTAVVIARESES